MQFGGPQTAAASKQQLPKQPPPQPAQSQPTKPADKYSAFDDLLTSGQSSLIGMGVEQNGTNQMAFQLGNSQGQSNMNNGFNQKAENSTQGR